MSCMIMAAEPLAALANAVETRLNCNYSYWGFDAPDSLYRELEDCKTSYTYHADNIYRRLYAVNVRAYKGRYRDLEKPVDEEAPTIYLSKYVVHHPPEYREHGFAVLPWHFQLAKLLDFWLYQTSEDATRSDPLRLAMSDFRDSLYCFIIQNSAQYTEARWGKLPQGGGGMSGKLQEINSRTLVKVSAGEHCIGFKTVSQKRKSGREFLVARDELAQLEHKNEIITCDIRSFAILSRDTSAGTLSIHFSWLCGCDSKLTGWEETVVLPYDVLTAFVEASTQKDGPKQWKHLSVQAMEAPKIVFLDKDRLRECLENSQRKAGAGAPGQFPGR